MRFAAGTGARLSRSSVDKPSMEHDMDKDRVEGSAEQAKGKVKEWAGKVTGDQKTQAEGKADQAAGKVQNAVGGLKALSGASKPQSVSGE
jgi:uncharacterized protein YjbJ (UPF0337 family)